MKARAFLGAAMVLAMLASCAAFGDWLAQPLDPNAPAVVGPPPEPVTVGVDGVGTITVTPAAQPAPADRGDALFAFLGGVLMAAGVPGVLAQGGAAAANAARKKARAS